jgi:hypothetical protein
VDRFRVELQAHLAAGDLAVALIAESDHLEGVPQGRWTLPMPSYWNLFPLESACSTGLQLRAFAREPVLRAGRMLRA